MTQDKTGKRPVYQNIFEYLVEHYEFKSPETSLTKHYKQDIVGFQYKHLTGLVSAEKTKLINPIETAKGITKFAKAVGANLVGFVSHRRWSTLRLWSSRNSS